VTCETGNVLFKHFLRDENDVECRFTCSEGHAEKRNADGVDGDCVPSLLQDSAAYFAHTLNVTNVRRVARSDAAEAGLAAFRFALSHTTHGHFVIVVGAAAPGCSERARQHLELHCCFSDLWRISTNRQMGVSERRNETCSRPSAPWSTQTSESQLEFEVPDARLPGLGTCVANGTGLDCEIVLSIIDLVLFKVESRTLRLQVQRASAHAVLNDAHRYVPLEGFAVEVQLAYFDGPSPVFVIVTYMAPLAAAATTTVALRGVGLEFVEPAPALNCERLSIAGDAASRRNWMLAAESTTAITFMRAGAGHSLVQLYYTLRLVDRETAGAGPNQMDITVWRNVSLRRAVCEQATPAQVIDTGLVFSASGLGADAVAHASKLLTPDHSVRGPLGALTSFVAVSLLRHVTVRGRQSAATRHARPHSEHARCLRAAARASGGGHHRAETRDNGIHQQLPRELSRCGDAERARLRVPVSALRPARAWYLYLHELRGRGASPCARVAARGVRPRGLRGTRASPVCAHPRRLCLFDHDGEHARVPPAHAGVAGGSKHPGPRQQGLRSLQIRVNFAVCAWLSFVSERKTSACAAESLYQARRRGQVKAMRNWDHLCSFYCFL
jgi:hypothetical protein